jgi:hypothetical protein
VPIPHGVNIDTTWVDQIGLKELNGYDEQLLADNANYPSPFKTTALLGRVMKVSTDIQLKLSSEELARMLPVGDRIALILHLRRITFGDRLQTVLECPKCKTSMSLELSISQFLQPTVGEPKKDYDITVENFNLKVRPLIGEDLEYLFFGVQEQGTNRQEELARRCILSAAPPLPDQLTDSFLEILGSKMEAIDRQANLIIDFSCIECQVSFEIPFNAEEFLFSELEARIKRLEREVHWLAFNYNWSEDAILTLSASKRKRYVDLINSTLAGETIL